MTVLVGLLVLATFSWLLVRREDVPGESVVEAVVGLPGSGKTYKLTEYALWSLRRARWAERDPRRSPVRIAANFDIGRWQRCHLVDGDRVPWPCFDRSCRHRTPAGRSAAVVPVFVPYSRIERIRDVRDLLAIRAAVNPWTRRP